MGFVIAVANAKGGVGKTTTSVSLAETLAAEGGQVLLIDFDAQANASFAVAGGDALYEIIQKEQTVEAYIAYNLMARAGRPMERFVAKNVSAIVENGAPLAIDLLAASYRLRMSERDVLVNWRGDGPRWEEIDDQIQRLFNADFETLRARYAFTIIDCAPGISAFTEVAIKFSDLVVVPTIPDFVSTLGLAGFTQFLDRLLDEGREGWAPERPRRPPALLATRVKPDQANHKTYLERLREEAAAEDGAFAMFDVIMREAAHVSGALELTDETDPRDLTFERRWGEIYGANLKALSAEIRAMLADGRA